MKFFQIIVNAKLVHSLTCVKCKQDVVSFCCLNEFLLIALRILFVVIFFLVLQNRFDSANNIPVVICLITHRTRIFIKLHSNIDWHKLDSGYHSYRILYTSQRYQFKWGWEWWYFSIYAELTENWWETIGQRNGMLLIEKNVLESAFSLFIIIYQCWKIQYFCTFFSTFLFQKYFSTPTTLSVLFYCSIFYLI